MRKAVIDIGTNSVLLLVAEITPSGLNPLCEKAAITRLGENITKIGVITLIAALRTITAVEEFIRIAKKYDTESIHLIGTEVFRRAENRDEIIKLFKLETGHDLNVISGREEAELSFKSALPIDAPSEEKFIVADIGGGSTDIAIGTKEKIENSVSLPFGAVTIREDFFKNFPPTEIEIDNAQAFILEEFTKIGLTLKPTKLVGVGGTVTTLAAMIEKMEEYDSAMIDGKVYSLEQIQTIFDEISSKTYEQIAALPGIEYGRADIITAGTLILKTLLNMQENRFSGTLVSTCGVRFAYLETLK